LARRLGISSRLHDLRHHAATALLDAGVPIVNVSRRLGHRDTSTTLNIYGHAIEATDRVAADVLGDALTARHRNVAAGPPTPV
jgi:integrase